MRSNSVTERTLHALRRLGYDIEDARVVVNEIVAHIASGDAARLLGLGPRLAADWMRAYFPAGRAHCSSWTCCASIRGTVLALSIVIGIVVIFLVIQPIVPGVLAGFGDRAADPCRIATATAYDFRRSTPP